MAETSIEWADAVWNPTTGCSKVSEGCRNCYAERLWPRLKAMGNLAYKDRDFNSVACHPERLDQLWFWKKPRRIFVNSMSDLFHEDVPDAFIEEVFAIMSVATQHTFMVLTKRPERMKEWFSNNRSMFVAGAAQQMGYKWKLPAIPMKEWWPLKNVWLGVSVENQAAADERIPLLLETPAAVRFISAEPLLGPLELANGKQNRWSIPTQFDENGRGIEWTDPGEKYIPIDWVICGGESGLGARAMHPDWARGLRDQCQVANVPFFFKQWGEWGWYQGGHHGMKFPEMFVDGERFKAWMVRVGKKKAGRELDGRTWDEIPEARR